MKNNKLLIILSSILLASVVFCSVMYALSNETSNFIETDGYTIRKGAVKTKNITDSNGFKRNLTYKRTENQVDNYVDIYVDESFNEYRYDKNQNLLGYSNNDTNTKLLAQIAKDKGLNTVIDELDAVKIATDYATKLYGDVFNEFEFETSVSLDYINAYGVHFSIRAGKNDCILVATCKVDVYVTGEILNCSMPVWYISNSVDTDKLSNIDNDMLEEFAIEEAKTVYGDELVNCSFDYNASAYLIEHEDKLVIAVPTVIELEEAAEDVAYTIKQGKEFYYEI